MQSMVGKISLTSQGKTNADLNNDGQITVIDLVKLKNLLIS